MQIVGPPGTGKTTFLASQVERASEVYGSESVVVTSLTRTAATEISGRGLRLPREHVGTLHSLCYRQLGSPPLVYKSIEDWNARHPNYAMTLVSAAPDRDAETQRPAGDLRGDVAMQEYDLLRHRMATALPAHVRTFAEAWESYKREIGAVDFTDMIRLAVDDIDEGPGRPLAILADEVQDYSRLETALLRKWGSRARSLVMAGDADQSIYQWRGADPDVFLAHDVGQNRRILAQSYRVPRAVHAVASSWIRKISRRIDAEYAPRDADGALHRTSAHWKYPEPMVAEWAKRLDAGETVMVLASCDYMLNPTIAVLRASGIPFSNPWRRANGAWNPLGVRRHGITTMSQRILAYLRPELDGEWWAADDLRRWTDVLRSEGIMKRGAKRAIETAGGAGDQAVGWDKLAEWFEDDALAKATDLDLNWWASSLLTGKKSTAEYPIRIYRKRGAAALQEEPRLYVGTIHSFKGAEADNVYLFPDLSPSGYGEYSGSGRDTVVRQFYVGMTRARETLTLASAASPYAVSW